MFDLFVRHFLAVPICDVSERERHGEEVRSQIEPASEERGVGVVRGQKRAGEEHRELLALPPEIEIEVLDPEKRNRIVKRLIVETSGDPERALLRDLLLDHAMSGLLAIRHQVAHPQVGVTHHLELRTVRGAAPLDEARRIDLDVLHLHVPLDRRRATGGREDLLPLDLERKHDVRPPRKRAIDLRLDVRERLSLQVELHGIAPQQRERLRVDPDFAAVHGLASEALLRRKRDLVRAPTPDLRRAGELISVVLGQPDVERKGRHLLRLQDRDLRKRLPLPLDAVQIELLPSPVRGLAPAEEEWPADRQVERLVDLGDAESERRLHVRDERRDLRVEVLA